MTSSNTTWSETLPPATECDLLQVARELFLSLSKTGKLYKSAGKDAGVRLRERCS